jgi:hypothetical protein
MQDSHSTSPSTVFSTNLGGKGLERTDLTTAWIVATYWTSWQKHCMVHMASVRATCSHVYVLGISNSNFWYMMALGSCRSCGCGCRNRELRFPTRLLAYDVRPSRCLGNHPVLVEHRGFVAAFLHLHTVLFRVNAESSLSKTFTNFFTYCRSGCRWCWRNFSGPCSVGHLCMVPFCQTPLQASTPYPAVA